MAGTAFNSAHWTGYDEQSWTNPDSDLSEFTGVIDVSNLSASFGSNVQSDGADIRITKGDDTELAYDLIDWDYNSGSPTGLIRFLWSGTLSSTGTQNVRVWVGYTGGTATAYSASDTYGSDNAYDSNWEGYWPLSSDFNDRTSNGYNGTAQGSLTAGDSTGKVGDATEFVDATDWLQIGDPVLGNTDFTVSLWIKRTDANSGWVLDNSLSSDSGMHMLVLPGDNFRTRIDGPGGNGGTYDSTSTLNNTTTWMHVVSLADKSGSAQHYIDGAADGATLNISGYGDISGSANMRMGRTTGVSDSGIDSILDDVQMHSTARSADWIALEYDQTNDNATFWGTWTWNSAGGGGISIPVVMHHRRLIGAA
jgi:hypothetical protein